MRHRGLITDKWLRRRLVFELGGLGVAAHGPVEFDEVVAGGHKVGVLYAESGSRPRKAQTLPVRLFDPSRVGW